MKTYELRILGIALPLTLLFAVLPSTALGGAHGGRTRAHGRQPLDDVDDAERIADEISGKPIVDDSEKIANQAANEAVRMAEQGAGSDHKDKPVTAKAQTINEAWVEAQAAKLFANMSKHADIAEEVVDEAVSEANAKPLTKSAQLSAKASTKDQGVEKAKVETRPVESKMAQAHPLKAKQEARESVEKDAPHGAKVKVQAKSSQPGTGAAVHSLVAHHSLTANAPFDVTIDAGMPGAPVPEPAQAAPAGLKHLSVASGPRPEASTELAVASERKSQVEKRAVTFKSKRSATRRVKHTPEFEAMKEAHNAAEYANISKQAATVAAKVAKHSVVVTKLAKSALKKALGALHDARVESAGLDKRQKHTLKKAEAKLRKATQKAEFGEVKTVEDAQRAEMRKEMGQLRKEKDELSEMRTEIRELRHRVKARGGDPDVEAELKSLEDELAIMEKEGRTDENDEIKVQIERLREQIEKSERAAAEAEAESNAGKYPKKEYEDENEFMKDVRMKPLGKERGAEEIGHHPGELHEAQHVESRGIDIDTQMPYGDLEPFGREDTAQELTEASVRESDEMVDQLERAEVAEEKRAVFRALTRLRGAAITSFDGVARSQTGNIDEFNKVHKWRNTHPLHHLADEESDVTKWAFPDNADFFLQKRAHGKAPN